MIEEKKDLHTPYRHSLKYNHASKIGNNSFPTNPMSERAIGHLPQRKVQTAISNYGTIISWDENPLWIWNGYCYLTSVDFLAGVLGYRYSNDFILEKNEFISGKLDMINNKDIAQGLYLHFIQNIDSSSGCSLDEIFG